MLSSLPLIRFNKIGIPLTWSLALAFPQDWDLFHSKLQSFWSATWPWLLWRLGSKGLFRNDEGKKTPGASTRLLWRSWRIASGSSAPQMTKTKAEEIRIKDLSHWHAVGGFGLANDSDEACTNKRCLFPKMLFELECDLWKELWWFSVLCQCTGK